MKRRILLSCLLTLCFLSNQLYAQQAVLAGGGEATGTGGTASLSLGQLGYIYSSSSTGSANGGVQQSNTSTTFPVALLDFTAFKKDKQVVLNWSTATEVNSNYFRVEKSLDGNNFSFLCTVKASRNSTSIKNYTSFDATPFHGINYYRLKQVDLDGHSVLSKIVTISLDENNIATVYPNPTSGNITLNINDYRGELLNYRLYDVKGSILLSGKITNKETLIELIKIIPANYFLKITNNNKEIKTFRIIKTK